MRAIYSYFLCISKNDLPYVHIPLHSVMALSVRAYGCDVKIIKLDIEAVDTHRDGRYSIEDGKHIKRGSYGDRGSLSISNKLQMSSSSSSSIS